MALEGLCIDVDHVVWRVDELLHAVVLWVDGPWVLLGVLDR